MIITISNQKGGVAKTTTAAAIASILSVKQAKTLLIDIDPQADLSYYMNASDNEITMYDVLCKNEKLKNAIYPINENLDIAPSDILLAGAEQEMNKTGKEFKLKEAIEELQKKQSYDFIIIDTPPSLGVLSVNAFTASDTIIIPSSAGIYSLKAFIQLSNTINSVKKYFNNKLTVSGVLITKFDKRTNISKEMQNMTDEISKKLKTKVFKTKIRTTVAVEEAQNNQIDITFYKPQSTVAIDYENFITEFLYNKENEK